VPGPGNQNFILQVDSDLCKRCHRCFGAQICRGKAIRTLDREDGPFVDMSRCWGCLTCLTACPFGAIVRSDYGDPLP
jgi:Fe-S-cluster-containing hydrogenase component 2